MSGTVKGKRSRKLHVWWGVWCFPTPTTPRFSLRKGNASVLGPPLFSSPAQSLPSLPPAADGAQAPAANLARRCQPQAWQTAGKREEDLLTDQADLPSPNQSQDPPSVPLQQPPQAAPHWSAPRFPNSASPSALLPTPSGSSPPATLTRAGVLAYLHMQIITFAYGAPQGGSSQEPAR